jgi:hypothetical protein
MEKKGLINFIPAKESICFLSGLHVSSRSNSRKGVNPGRE